ncbi:flagellar hook-length control protein FliK [Pseudocitrobacter cyperus]|uniref:Flagellar hook-length control protein FliK n=1 Tax=Pseudocitrobacter cyperus TaxID=3112843 RepID=A0ABV0HH76_9ENTR
MTDLLNLALGAGNTAGVPAQAELIGGQSVVAEATTASTPMAFSEALLNVVNTLMVGQGKSAPGMSVSAQALRQKADESDDDLTAADSSLLRADAQQQLLDALLMPRPQPLNLETASSGDLPTAATLISSLPTAVAAQAPMVKGMLQQQPVVNADSTLLNKTDVPPAPLPAGQQLAPQLMTLMTAVTPEVAAQPVTASSAVSPDVRPTQTSTLQLDTEDPRWSQQLQRVLGERLQVQVKNQIQHATIRLDPPDMGKIDISLQIDNGRMQVQINASHAEVYRALQQTSNDLRQSLTEQNFVQVNVQVSSQSGGQQHHQGSPFAEQQAVIQSAAEIAAAATVPDNSRREDDSVLLTV